MKILSKLIVRISILVIGVLLFLYACDPKEEASPIFMQIMPSQSSLHAEGGKKLVFQISVSAQSPLTGFYITQTDDEVGVTTIFDSVLTQREFLYTYVYDVPQVEDSTEVLLTFRAETTNDKMAIGRRITITGNEDLLDETTGHIIYSALSARESAFNLDDLQSIFPEDHDISDIHIQDNSDSLDGNQLSREWISPAGYHFVRFEGLRYAEATGSMVQNAYDYGVHMTRVQDIVDDDIVIVGNGSLAIAAVLVVQVLDVDSTVNDKYIINVKKLD